VAPLKRKVVMNKPNVEVTGAARLYRAASLWTAGLGLALNGNANPKQKSALATRRVLATDKSIYSDVSSIALFNGRSVDFSTLGLNNFVSISIQQGQCN